MSLPRDNQIYLTFPVSGQLSQLWKQATYFICTTPSRRQVGSLFSLVPVHVAFRKYVLVRKVLTHISFTNIDVTPSPVPGAFYAKGGYALNQLGTWYESHITIIHND